MIKIMLICNGKFTKKNPFNRAFLHGRKGLCMSYKEFIENLQKEIESRIGEATILFHKVTKNNGVTKDCFLIRPRFICIRCDYKSCGLRLSML